MLPSLLEALPTVAVEALACGTPVVSSDNPGGLELNDVFGRDVALVPREQPLPLARAIVAFLDDKRRTTAATRETIEREFRPAGVAAPLPRALHRAGRSADAGNRRGGDGMIRGAGRVAAVAAIAALAGGGLAGASLRPLAGAAARVRHRRRRPRSSAASTPPNATTPAAGRSRGPAETLTIRLDDLDRQVAWSLDLTRPRRARRRRTQSRAAVLRRRRRTSQTIATTVDFADARVAIPPRRPRAGLTLELRSSSTFVPGPGDTRALGVMLDRLALTPDGIALPPRAAFAGVALASAAAAAGVALLGVTAGSAIGAALLISAGLAALVAHGFGPYTDIASVAARTSAVDRGWSARS